VNAFYYEVNFVKAAIYSRKSIFTGKGESIENQIEFCMEYGNKLGVTEYCIYEDEGYSGGNTNRPKFQQLLRDVKKKQFDILICYRLDRISRNVADFSNTLELLQQNNISFVSIREQFDTSTPMGRAMVYIASVFAQLERETIAERVKDNMLQLAKTGRWLGGQEPYGYKADRITYIDEEFRERSLMRLMPIDEELQLVKLIYIKYLELASITKVVKHLSLKNVQGKNGGQWAFMQVKRLLSNPLYVKSTKETSQYLIQLGINVFGEANENGYLTYNKTKNIVQDRDITEWIAAIGAHAGIIDSDIWLRVQQLLKKNNTIKPPRLGTGESSALLTGILICDKCGSNMLVKQGHSSRTNINTRYDYYVCSSKLTNKSNSNKQKCDNRNIRVDKLDSSIISKIKAYDKAFLIDELSKAINDAYEDNFHKDQIDSIAKKIHEKEKSISNLIIQLANSKNEEINKYILIEIEKLNEEVKKLKLELGKIKSLYKSPSNLDSDNEFILTIIDALDKNLNYISDIVDKRNLLRAVIDVVSWNGDTNSFKIKLLENNKKR
jgi:DNA invertase Pin-like site-specific DNA recombinase